MRRRMISWLWSPYPSLSVFICGPSCFVRHTCRNAATLSTAVAAAASPNCNPYHLLSNLLFHLPPITSQHLCPIKSGTHYHTPHNTSSVGEQGGLNTFPPPPPPPPNPPLLPPTSLHVCFLRRFLSPTSISICGTLQPLV